ncbi:MAG: hypothetical protein K0S56_1508 [Microvirga sp.]|nr:hypothetical protein [Microvirga sp.]
MRSVASRRSFMSAAGIAAIASLSIAAEPAKASRPSCTPRLMRLIALYDRADVQCDDFDREVEMPARDACRAAIDALPSEPPPPHVESRTTFENAFGESARLSTSVPGIVASARRWLSDPAFAGPELEDWRQAHREILEANEKREALIAAQTEQRRALEAEERSRFRIEAIAARSAALARRRDDLGDAVLEMPAANLRDLTAKLGFIERLVSPGEVTEHEFAFLSADIRRLAGEV